VNPLILYLFGLTTTNPPEVVDTVLQRWEDAGIEVQVVSVHCDEDNAAYYHEDKLIVMCDDLYDRPELARWVLAHELGHAFTMQHDVPMTYGHDEERSADELAFLTSETDENYAAARWFLHLHKQHPIHMTADPHPAPLDRAAELLCMLDGQEAGGTRVCRVMSAAVTGHWRRMLAWLNR
jgi:Zn-dependent protease with chaperone function